MLLDTKNKMIISVILFLLLAGISIIKPYFLNCLFKTYLGRSLLVAVLIFITYCNKIMGIISLLTVIIFYNAICTTYANSYEGFTDASGNSTTTTTTTTTPTARDGSGNVLSKLQELKSTHSEDKDLSASSTTVEGFDYTGMSDSMRRGKQSNTIPVTTTSTSDNEIAPTSKETFTSKYSLY